MLKDLVRERLMAAADEILEMFERTIASYEEQLCRVKDESERQRRQLEAVGMPPDVPQRQGLYIKRIILTIWVGNVLISL